MKNETWNRIAAPAGSISKVRVGEDELPTQFFEQMPVWKAYVSNRIAPRVTSSRLVRFHKKKETTKPYHQQLYRFVGEERRKYKVYPPGADVFNALRYTPFERVRVVIIG